jgi:hypothetical protein
VAETAAAKTAGECDDVEAQSAKADFVPFQRRVSNPASTTGGHKPGGYKPGRCDRRP